MNIKQQKKILLDKLHEQYNKCLNCPLATQGRTTVVFGEGNPDARIIFLGEGPGRQEDLEGKPFVGRSGKLLTHILTENGINREEIFITNIVKCRPPNNRKPLPVETATCKKILLQKQIHIIQPYVICTLGSTALFGLTDQANQSITSIRGKPFMHQSFIVVPTYHPAYILRNPPAYKFLFEDIQKTIAIAQACEAEEYQSSGG